MLHSQKVPIFLPLFSFVMREVGCSTLATGFGQSKAPREGKQKDKLVFRLPLERTDFFLLEGHSIRILHAVRIEATSGTVTIARTATAAAATAAVKRNLSNQHILWVEAEKGS